MTVEKLKTSRLCFMGKVSQTDENVKRRYQLDSTKVLTAPIVNRTYYTEPVEIFSECPLNAPGQENDAKTVDLTRLDYDVIGFEPVDAKKQACQNFLADKAVNASSQRLYACGDLWEHYQYFDESGKPYKMAYGYTLEKPSVDEYVSYLVSQLRLEDVEECLEDLEEFLETKNPDEKLTDIPVHAYDRREERKRYIQKLKKTVRRLINANRLTYMYTLTFALDLNENVHGLRFVLSEDLQRDRHEVFRVWNTRLTYIRRKLKERYDREFKFVLVPEIHDGDHTDPRKKGTYHLHLATDKPLDKAELQALWGYGVVWIDDFSREKTFNQESGRYETHETDFLNDPGRYMAKYLEKELDSPEEDFELWKQHKYSSSRNLKRPEKLKIRDEQAIDRALKTPSTVFDFDGVSKVQAAKVNALKDINAVKTFENTYDVEFQKWDHGEMKTVKLKVHYTCYNFRLLLPGAKRLDKHLPPVEKNRCKNEGKKAIIKKKLNG